MFRLLLLVSLIVSSYSELITLGERPPPCYQDISKMGQNVCNAMKSTGHTNECGISFIRKRISYIVGGTEAYPGSWPWIVMLLVSGVRMCAGTILNNDWVLTAAHCFDYAQLRNASLWNVTSGKHHSNCTDTTEQEWPVSQIVIHPGYVAPTNENDIALLKLSKPLTYNCRTQPICLPKDDKPLKTGRFCKIAGWGMTFGKGSRTALNELTLPVINGSLCGSLEYYGNRYHEENMVCLGYPEGGLDACNGDSGGPMVCNNNGKWILSGVTSWGLGCAQPKQPGVYTRIRPFMTWIKKYLNANENGIVG